jgi:hypothetical protein
LKSSNMRAKVTQSSTHAPATTKQSICQSHA